ncbi:MAG: tautomerase family protein [Deltaproteobacteria bacterium]|nr:tautomerase family protein [Deltaproteobacteria bacterium]
MPILRASMWAGRTKALTDTMVQVAGVPPESVIIQFEDLPKENRATEGKLHSEIYKDQRSWSRGHGFG